MLPLRIISAADAAAVDIHPQLMLPLLRYGRYISADDAAAATYELDDRAQ